MQQNPLETHTQQALVDTRSGIAARRQRHRRSLRLAAAAVDCLRRLRIRRRRSTSNRNPRRAVRRESHRRKLRNRKLPQRSRRNQKQGQSLRRAARPLIVKHQKQRLVGQEVSSRPQQHRRKHQKTPFTRRWLSSKRRNARGASHFVSRAAIRLRRSRSAKWRSSRHRCRRRRNRQRCPRCDRSAI